MIDKCRQHERICAVLNEMYRAKNTDYGDAYALLRKEYPASICYRLTDKLNRLKTLYCREDETLIKSESVEDTLMDIANYAIMELIERRTHEGLHDKETPCMVAGQSKEEPILKGEWEKGRLHREKAGKRKRRSKGIEKRW